MRFSVRSQPKHGIERHIPLKYHINAFTKACCAGRINSRLIGKVSIKLGDIIFASQCWLKRWFKFTIDNVGPINMLK